MATHKTFAMAAIKGLELFGQIWMPEGEPKAMMCLAHGHGDHSGRYAHIAEFLNKQGIGVYAFDHYGHGKSGGKRGTIPSYEAVLDSIEALVRQVKSSYSETPVFLYGHSMGGNLVANYVLRRDPQLAGIILSAPFFRLAFKPNAFDLFLAKTMLPIAPNFTQPSKLDVKAISRDAAEVQRYVDDPLIHSQMSPRLFTGLIQGGEYAMENASSFSLPLLIMHGSGDRITSFEASEAFANNVPGDVTWKAWEGYFHEIHNESEADKAPVLQAIGDWIMKKV